jgi:DNA-binding NarL/FixJ family response regulator
MPAPIKLLVVDDHPTLRHGLISMLKAFDDQFQVVGEAANGEEAVLKFVGCQPDVVVTDLHFAPSDPTDGIDLILELRELHPQVQVMLLTAELNDEYLLLAHDIGANAFLSKHASASEIAKAIDAVASGFTHFPARLREVLGKRKSEPRLTDREKQLLPLIAMGRTAKEMSKDLSALGRVNPISNRTIEIHRANIRRKFGLTSANALIAFSIDYCKKIRK